MKTMDDFDLPHAFRMLRKQREAAQRGLPCPNFEDLLAEVLAEMGEEAPAEKRPTLVAVTPVNAAQFKPAPKRRGRKPKVQLGGNVVAFARPLRADWPEGWSERLESAYVRLRRTCDDGALPAANRADRQRLRSTLERIAPRAEPQLRGNAVALKPAPCDRMLEAEIRGVAIANLVRDLRRSETTGAPMRMNFQQHIAAAWRERGYTPPGAA